TARKGHSLANGHVARLALEVGAELVLNTDAHEPGDLIGDDMARTVLLGAGVPEDRLDAVFKKMQTLAGGASAALRPS
ncbi:MAG: PHP domain-containing protein, partial [Nitrospinota bacterium]